MAFHSRCKQQKHTSENLNNFSPGKSWPGYWRFNTDLVEHNRNFLSLSQCRKHIHLLANERLYFIWTRDVAINVSDVPCVKCEHIYHPYLISFLCFLLLAANLTFLVTTWILSALSKLANDAPPNSCLVRKGLKGPCGYLAIVAETLRYMFGNTHANAERGKTQSCSSLWVIARVIFHPHLRLP